MPEIKLKKRLPNLTPEEEIIFTEAVMEAYLRGKTDGNGALGMKKSPIGCRCLNRRRENDHGLQKSELP